MKSQSAQIKSKCLLFSALSDKIIDCVVNRYHLGSQNCRDQCYDEPGNVAGERFQCFISNSSNKFPCYLYLIGILVKNILHSFSGNYRKLLIDAYKINVSNAHASLNSHALL